MKRYEIEAKITLTLSARTKSEALKSFNRAIKVDKEASGMLEVKKVTQLSF